MRRIMYTPVNPTFHLINWGFLGFLLYGLVNVMSKLFDAFYGTIE